MHRLMRAALAAVLVATAAIADEAKRVIVLDLRGAGVDATVLPPLTAEVTRAVGSLPGYEVASAEEVRRMLSVEKTRQEVGCDADTACIADITSKLNADHVVNGIVGKVGDRYTLSIALTQPKKAGSAARASETVDSLDQLPKAIPGLVAEVFGVKSRAVKQKYTLPKKQKLKFAVFDLKATGVAPEVVQNLTQILAVEVKGVEGTSVVSRDDIKALLSLEKEKVQFGCDDTSCMAEIGAALGVNKLIVGSVGKLADTFVVSLQLMDSRKSQVENRVTETFKGEDDQLIRATRCAVRDLLGIEVATPGKLAVTATQPGAEVFVDDEKRGKTPDVVGEVKPGRHSVRFSKGGYFDWQADFYVDPLETTSAFARLSERPERWYQKWWVWTIAGGVVAGGTTALFFATRPAPTTGSGTAVLP